MNVVLADEAKADLERIAEYIGHRNPERASAFVNQLLDRCESLAAIPAGFPLVPRYEARGIRRRPHGNYSIFYRIVGNDIVVIHILHGAREYEALLFPDS
jgi:addiction module RelE/StbE family toxin